MNNNNNNKKDELRRPRGSILRPLKVVADLFTKPIEMIGQIYRNEGVTALWKGLGPNLVGIVPARAIYFGTYSQGKSLFTEMNGGQEDSFIHLTSAAVAGITVATVTCPIWVVKTRMQLQSSASAFASASKHPNPVGMMARPPTGDISLVGAPYKNSIDCVKRVIVEEGVSGLYKGLGASYLGVIESTLQFVLYEKTKLLVKEYRKEHSLTSNSKTSRFQGCLSFFFSSSFLLFFSFFLLSNL
jgi:solute carrier family 25 protein 33/36